MFLLRLFKKRQFKPIQGTFHKGIRRRNYMLAKLLWEAAVTFEAAPITGPLNLKLATCVSGIGKCERHHKSTQQHRTKQGNRKLGSTTAAFCEIKMACCTRRQENETRKRDEENKTRPSILALFKDSMRKFARHRNGLKEARDAIVASRAARAALRIADSESDMSSDDDMEGNSGDENTEFEEFVDEIMSDYQPELDEEEDCSDSE
jgi:hypothetical protein